MATDTETHGQHVTPLKIYLGVGAALFVLTVITVAVSYIDLGPFNLVVAMGIATVKAALVALVFMHLYYDDKLYLTIFIMALLMLSLFIVITLFDTLRRGDLYEEAASPLRQEALIYQQDTTETGAHTTEDSTADTTGTAVHDTTRDTTQETGQETPAGSSH